MNPRVGAVLGLLGLFSAALAHVAPPVPLAQIAPPQRQFGLPFAQAPGVNTWLLGQLYGNTTGAYRRRNSDYRGGQGIHFGMDFSAPCGTPVLAIGDGVVSEVSGSHGSAPHNLVLEHAGNLASLYGHLQVRSSLRVGQRVRRGQQIGISGDSQFTCQSAPHLHLELRDRSHQRFLNPVGYIAADWNTLALLGGFGRGYQRDLANPRRWQSLEDQPSARRGGALLNNYRLPFPVASGDTGLVYPPRIQHTTFAATTSQLPDSPRSISGAGCCVTPFWSADSSRVMFIDKPNANPAAIYSIVAAKSSTPQRELSSVVRLSPSQQYAVLSGSSRSQLEHLPSGERVQVPASSVVFSPSEQQVAWVVSSQGGRFDTTRSLVYVASLSRTPRLKLGAPKQVQVLYGGGISGWLSERELLVNGKTSPQTRDRQMWRLELGSLKRQVYAQALNFRGVLVSPDGRFVLYYVAFDSRSRNGLFVLDTRSNTIQKLPWLGSYRFRDSSRVVFIPMQSAATHQVFEWDSSQNTQRLVVDLQSKVAGDDWQVSPNGSSLVWVNAGTRRLQVIGLGD
jgi:Peptidase family M23